MAPEWRLNLTTRWLVMSYHDTREDARYQGQLRIVAQEVVEVVGLGA